MNLLLMDSKVLMVNWDRRLFIFPKFLSNNVTCVSWDLTINDIVGVRDYPHLENVETDHNRFYFQKKNTIHF